MNPILTSQNSVHVGDVSVGVLVARPEALEVEGLLAAEDRYRIMGPSGDLPIETADASSVHRAMEAAESLERLDLGRVLVSEADGRKVLRLVLFDVDETPPTTPEVVAGTLAAAWDIVARLGLRSVALSPLGTGAKALSLEDFARLLVRSLFALPADAKLERVWVAAPDPEGADRILDLLAEALREFPH